MTTGRVVALYDANVLYPAPLRDFLIRLAMTGLVSARWSDTIHEEWTRNLLKNRPDLRRDQLERTRTLMELAVPGARVENFEHRIAALNLPDPHDRHVLAAAIEGDAETIVTFNTRDFPQAVLGPYGIQAQPPDDLVLDLLSRHPETIHALVRAHRRELRNPPKTVDEYLEVLGRVGLGRTVERLRNAGVEL